MTTAEAPISISESRPNPASATDRALIAATASTTIPATFQPRVAHSSANPRRTRARPAASPAAVTGAVCHSHQASASRGPAGEARCAAEEGGDMSEQQYRQCDVGDQAAGQNGMVVRAEGEGVAEVGDHREPSGPPCPALSLPERDGQKDDEQRREGEFVQG